MRCLHDQEIFSTDFKLEAVGLVLDQGYSTSKACKSMGLGPTALRRWAEQLRSEHGDTPTLFFMAVLHSTRCFQLGWQTLLKCGCNQANLLDKVIYRLKEHRGACLIDEPCFWHSSVWLSRALDQNNAQRHGYSGDQAAVTEGFLK
ncbi:transposase [Pseudomonas guineae]|uniref:transposase n=1 Tax=Pseudomonas guineae TaxID=425504 RepID=UPI000B7EACBA